MNLQTLSKWMIIAGIGFLFWSLAPWAKCAFSSADNTSIGAINESDDTMRSSSDVARVNRTSGFLGNFFGGAGACYSAHPIQNSVPVPFYGMLGLLGGGVLLTLVGRITGPGPRT